ncbi:hypothetical protein Tco_1379141 [Tanacetum coccineum]
MSIRAQTPMSFPYEAEIDRHLAIPSPPSSPYYCILITTLQPSSEQALIHWRAVTPLLPITLPLQPHCHLRHAHRAYMVMMRAAAPSLTQEVACGIALSPRYEVGESSYAATARPTGGFRTNYGFIATLDAKIRRDLDREIGYEITDVWEDPDEIAEEIS